MTVALNSYSQTGKYQIGLSLIELMVAMTISLMLLAGVITIVGNSNKNYAELSRASQQMENGRYAIQILQDDVKLAGFFGELRMLPGVPAALPDPCATAEADHEVAIGLAIQGYNSPPGTPLAACLGSANFKSGTDVLVLRRAATSTSAMTALKDNVVYLQAISESFLLEAEDTDRTNDDVTFNLSNRQGAADIRQFLTHIYFISPCNVCGTDSVPTLKRLELSTVGNGYITVPLVEGIEDLQFDYGIDTSGNGSANEYTDGPADSAEWSNVVSLRINLLARNIEKSPGHKDVKKYSLGLNNDAARIVGPFDDGYKRHAFSAVVRAVNPSGRRE